MEAFVKRFVAQKYFSFYGFNLSVRACLYRFFYYTNHQSSLSSLQDIIIPIIHPLEMSEGMDKTYWPYSRLRSPVYSSCV